MAEPRRKDFVSEVIRLCKNLTNFKCDEEYDWCLKSIIADYLEQLKYLPAKNQNKFEAELLEKAQQLVNTKFGKSEDLKIKEEIKIILFNLLAGKTA